MIMKAKVLHTVLRLLAVLTLMMAGVTRAVAQGDAVLTHYWVVPTYYNPGAAGDTDNIRLRGGMRAQWVGIDNAPRTFVACADSPFKLFGRKWGGGAVIQQESYGLFNNLTASLQLAFKQRIKPLRGELTVGLQAGVLNERFKGSEIYIPDDDDYHTSTDPALPGSDLSGSALDLGLGVYFVHPRFKAGVSLLHATSPTVTFSDTEGGSSSSGTVGEGSGTAGEGAKNYQFQAPRTLVFTAEGNIQIKNTLFEVIPSLLVRSDFTYTDVAATARVRWRKMFSAGIGYRHSDAVSLMLGAEIKGIFVGYSYDYHISEISKASSGSHEIFAGYNLKLDFSEKNRNRHKSIRIM